MTEPTPAHRRLEAFVGTWIGDDTMYPSPWLPQGGRGVTTYQGRSALGGFFVVGDDRQERPGLGDYSAHKVFGYDPSTGEYTFYLVDSVGQNSPSTARGRWEGDTVSFEQATPQGRVRYRYAFREDGGYLFQMAFSQDGGHWHPFIDGVYRKQ